MSISFIFLQNLTINFLRISTKITYCSIMHQFAGKILCPPLHKSCWDVYIPPPQTLFFTTKKHFFSKKFLGFWGKKCTHISNRFLTHLWGGGFPSACQFFFVSKINIKKGFKLEDFIEQAKAVKIFKANFNKQT